MVLTGQLKEMVMRDDPAGIATEYQPQYAGLGRRFVALMIDFMLLSMIFFPVTRIVKGVWLMSAGDHLWGYGWFITDPLCISFLVIIVLYFVLLEGMFGATIGKRLSGLLEVIQSKLHTSRYTQINHQWLVV